jgi:hypothetical protein
MGGWLEILIDIDCIIRYSYLKIESLRSHTSNISRIPHDNLAPYMRAVDDLQSIPTGGEDSQTELETRARGYELLRIANEWAVFKGSIGTEDEFVDFITAIQSVLIEKLEASISETTTQQFATHISELVGNEYRKDVLVRGHKFDDFLVTSQTAIKNKLTVSKNKGTKKVLEKQLKKIS